MRNITISRVDESHVQVKVDGTTSIYNFANSEVADKYDYQFLFALCNALNLEPYEVINYEE